jgi:hypothetical protein
VNPPRSLLDEDDLFGEGRHQVVHSRVQLVEAKEPEVKVAKQEKRELQRPMGVQGGPAGWRRNASRRHFSEGRKIELVDGTLVDALCACVGCLQEEHLFIVGPPWGFHPAFPSEDLEEAGFVGLYNPEEYEPPTLEVPVKEVCTPCAVCGEGISIAVVTLGRAFTAETEELVHVECLTDESQAAIKSIGYTLPILVRSKEVSSDSS